MIIKRMYNNRYEVQAQTPKLFDKIILNNIKYTQIILDNFKQLAQKTITYQQINFMCRTDYD